MNLLGVRVGGAVSVRLELKSLAEVGAEPAGFDRVYDLVQIPQIAVSGKRQVQHGAAEDRPELSIARHSFHLWFERGGNTRPGTVAIVDDGLQQRCRARERGAGVHEKRCVALVPV